ncbi:efflux RND transporter periplasmic adaptor subunit [Sinanaerobacter sp. ZZT-01]|uniref:efflux RND transporter periplasmic adaptor subunit n=1 Tax=Sinanaerobacter sp. ZZT-01 TaxID=3111540 RepID=UPI002D772611|nr:efflux RND transporter periplasmic adaptor subunit [Sinanaerobacter sp. ZZT-01]WRR93722.1 efflux RND transporter periplasmic adaptor subunit [Sinanaerobacter sp. ZZT-01]
MFHKKEKDAANVMADHTAGDEAVLGTQDEVQTESTASANKKKKKKTKGKKKFIILGIAILVVAIAVLKMTSGGKEIKPMVATVPLTTMDLEQIVSIKGYVQGSETADVTSSQSKEVVSILVKEGDTVTKGQLLATLKSSSDDAENQLVYEKEEAVRNLELAKFDYETSKSLYESGGISKQEFLKSEAAYENSKTTLNSLNSKNLSEKNRIISPISGTVTRVNATLGLQADETQGKGALFVIENLQQLQMDVNVSEYDIGNIKVGQTVNISAEVLGDKLVDGVVEQIAPTGEEKEAGNKEMVIPVTILITESDSRLIAGVSAKANIKVGEANGVLALPLDAVVDDPLTGESYVFILEKGKLKKIIVEKGLESDFYAELVSGDVKEGDQLVISPSADFADGMEVDTMAGVEEDE